MSSVAAPWAPLCRIGASSMTVEAGSGPISVKEERDSFCCLFLLPSCASVSQTLKIEKKTILNK